ncbi:MAG: formate/nitrite transporter family protein [Thermoanaerobaculia bacterium]|nr:formate/nitrite transporter family protein [Thermoanaerobaculia bacterium]
MTDEGHKKDEGLEEPESSPSDEKNKRDAEERTAPPGSVVYQAILTEGVQELRRCPAALWWSGLAAGLSMGFSLVAEGLLSFYLPEARWTPLVTKLGYSVGFLIVILGRQQLFTENTLTAILPLLNRREGATIRDVSRLWSIVLAANLVGAAVFAIGIAELAVFDHETRAAFQRVGEVALAPSPAALFVKAIFAGWLIALMVWLLPYAESARVLVIVIVTYLIGLGGFAHIIAGSVEVMFVAAVGGASWIQCIAGYMLPTLAGNIIGGVALVAALNHAQVVADRELH